MSLCGLVRKVSTRLIRCTFVTDPEFYRSYRSDSANGILDIIYKAPAHYLIHDKNVTDQPVIFTMFLLITNSFDPSIYTKIRNGSKHY